MILWTVILGFFLLSAAVQIYYLLGAFSGLAFDKITPGAFNKSPVSIIVCAHNELENLKVLIPKLQTQLHPNFQVVIALDRCLDGSYEWLTQLDWEALSIIVINQVPGNFNPKKFALREAINKASNPLLVLTDADCYPASDHWLSLMCRQFQEKNDVVLGYSPYLKRPGLLNLFIRYETLMTGIQYLSRAIRGYPYMGVGRNLAYRRSFFEDSDQLATHLQITGGDDDLLINANAEGGKTAVCIEAQAQVYSIPETSFSSYFRQKKRHLSVSRHYKARDKLLLGIFSLSHTIFWSSLVSLLVATSTYLVLIFILLVFRQIVLSIIVVRSSHRLGDRFPWFALPLTDMLYSIYIALTGILALSSKKVNWK